MRFAILLVPVALIACGGYGSGANAASAVVALQSAGASPTSLSVSGNGQIQFINNDAADHQIASGDCAELVSPKLAAGAIFTATMGVGPKSCSFNDGLNPSAAAFQGTVTVAQAHTGNPYGGL